MGYVLRYRDLPLSEHCKPILLPGGDRALACPPGSPGATHRGTWVAFGSPSPARHRGLGAHGSATPAAPASAVLWGRRRASSPSFSPIIVSRFFPLVGTRLLPSWGRILLLWHISSASLHAWLKACSTCIGGLAFCDPSEVPLSRAERPCSHLLKGAECPLPALLPHTLQRRHRRTDKRRAPLVERALEPGIRWR